MAAPEPAVRARTAIGTALGIVYPTAVPLSDGRVWLTSRQDVLPAYVVRALEAQLSRRAADHAHDDRLLAEAVGVLGAEVARVRGESPADGATAALDRFLHVPGLDQSRRTEAEAMLRVALRSAAPESPEAAARLERLPGTSKPVAASEVVSASQQISRDARLLATTAPARSSPGRRRPQVGNNHRRPSRRQTLTRAIRGTGLVTGAAGDPEQSRRTALDVLETMSQDELGSSLTAKPAVDPQAELAVVRMTASAAPQHVRVEVLPTVGGLVAQGRVRSGTANDPHVLRISPGLADTQYRHIWAHQLSLMTQQLAAAKAERPTGILGRLRSPFGHEGRDRRVRADNAAYQLLTQDWRQARAETLANGRPTGPRSVAELEQDIQGLAKAIGRRSGTEPALPWAVDAIATADASETGLAAARAEADATPARHTPGHLRQQVITQITTLEAAAADLDGKARTKTLSAATAITEAGQSERDAQVEETGKDLGAPERARKLRVAAVAAGNKARRHTEIAGAYGQAATDARHALAGYQALLSELDANGSQTRIAELARQAASRVEVYESSADQATPVKDLLETGVPTGKPLTVPLDEINQVLARYDCRERLGSDAPIPMPGAEYRRLLSPDGMVFTVGGTPDDDVTRITQVRLRIKPRDVTEVVDRDYDLAEQMSGTLGEGGQSFATTSTHASNVTVGVNVQPFLAMAAPGTPLHVASQLLSPRGEVSTGRTLAETSGATAHHQSGWVDVNRGESLLYEWSGEWEIEVRNSPTEPWSPVETADAGRQLTWVSSAYTVKPPAETVSLEELGRGAECTTEFPRHTVTRISGLQRLNDRLVAETQQKYGGIDRVTFDHISGLITQDSHRLLREATAPGGITRPIPSGGETEYELTLEVEPVWSTAELSGESSSEMWQEEVLVDFAGVNASQSYGTSLTGTASLAFPGKAVAQPVPGFLPSPKALNDVAGSGADLSPSVSVGRNVSRQGGQAVSSTSITPAVHRNQGPTQGVIVDLRVKATLRNVNDRKSEPIVIADTCKARLRVPENDLLRAGGRADKNAVRREPDGAMRFDQDDRVLLRGDPEPPTGPQALPPWLGRGENQLRGPGKALPQNLRGAEETQRQALLKLSAMGLVPPLDSRLKPRRDKMPTDPLRRASQLANYDRITQQITAPRIEAGMNQACQGGLIVVLDDHRTGRAPHYRNFRLSVTQDFDDVQGRGTSTTENIVRLGISSRATGRTSGRSKAVPISGGVGAKAGPAPGVRGWAGRLGIKLSRSALGRSFSWTVGRRVQRVTLNESSAETDRLRQGARITFAEVTDKGDSEPLADVRGSFEVEYDSALSRAEAPVFEADPKAPSALAVRQAIPVAVDAGNPADRIFSAVSAIRADSSAFQQLHTFLSPDSLVANRDWMSGSYELPMVVIPAPANPAQALEDRTLLPQQLQIVIRGEATALTFAAISEQTTVDINFTMTDVGLTSGTSHSGGLTVDGGAGPTEADGSGWSGGATIGRTGGRSQSTSNSQTSGEERLLVNGGTHYEFLERYKLVADIVQDGRVIQTVRLEDALAQKAMAERRALELYAGRKLDLPLPVVADAAERYLEGKLELDPRTAAGFVRRYRHEKAGATTGLAATHTDERLTEKVVRQTKVPMPHAPTPSERLETAADRAERLADQPRIVHLSGAYDASLASSQLESITPEGKPDEQVELLALINQQIEEVAPGLQQASPLLAAELQADLSPDSYQGHLEDMLGPRGYVGSIEVPVEGRELPDVLLVRVRAHFEGEITIDGTPEAADGTPEIPKVAAGSINQAYDYAQRDRSTGHTTTYSGTVQAADANSAGGSMSGSAGTDRTRTHTAGSGEQNTTLDRTGHFDVAKVNRKIVFTTEVVRLHNAGAATMASLRWKLDRTTLGEVTTVSQPRQLRADLTALVPRGLITDGPAAVAQQTAGDRLPEHRTFELPESASVERAAPYLKGEPESDRLFDEVGAFLSRPGVLGEAGFAEHKAMVGAQLQPTALKAKFERLTSAQGLHLVPMAARGNGRTTVAVAINATPIGWVLEDDGVDGQSGKVRRRQEATRSSSTGNHATPVTATGGFDAGIVAVTGSVGEQVKEQSSDAHGTRLEATKIEEGKLVTVRIPVVYDVTVRHTTDKGRGTPQTTRTTQLRDVAHGEYYVKMLRHEYLEGLRQMEEGASMDAVLAGARLEAVPPDLGRPDLEATEYAEGPSGPVYQPYQPLLQALAKAKAERRTVVLAMRETDGTERVYEAFQDGNMRCAGDGGFATAFATLHRDVVRMAEGRVDLRKLYNTSSPDGSFSAKVAAELEKSGVPASMLKGLDYATTAREFAASPSKGGKHSAASGRTIAPSGHGPSLSGP
ncbi:hypothetical protein [Kribbella sp. NBC_00359]|uniref:hypothetical protein n=1 Tax=Kribbella sp. NBC_00359 TaxID=2975966 RepID=UPI002E1AEC6F